MFEETTIGVEGRRTIHQNLDATRKGGDGRVETGVAKRPGVAQSRHRQGGREHAQSHADGATCRFPPRRTSSFETQSLGAPLTAVMVESTVIAVG